MADKPTDTRSPQEIIDGMKQAEQTQAMDAYNVGFTTESPEAIRERQTAEWEAGKARKSEDQARWEAGQKQAYSEDFWKFADATDPAMLAAGTAGAYALKSATPLVDTVLGRNAPRTILDEMKQAEQTQAMSRFAAHPQSSIVRQGPFGAQSDISERWSPENMERMEQKRIQAAQEIMSPNIRPLNPDAALDRLPSEFLDTLTAVVRGSDAQEIVTQAEEAVRTAATKLPNPQERAEFIRIIDGMQQASRYSQEHQQYVKELEALNQKRGRLVGDNKSIRLVQPIDDALKQYNNALTNSRAAMESAHSALLMTPDLQSPKMKESIAKEAAESMPMTLSTEDFLARLDADPMAQLNKQIAKAAKTSKKLGRAAAGLATAPALAVLAPSILAVQSMMEQVAAPDEKYPRIVAHMAFKNNLKRPVESSDLSPTLIQFFQDNPQHALRLYYAGAVSTDFVEEITGKVPAKPSTPTPRPPSGMTGGSTGRVK